MWVLSGVQNNILNISLAQIQKTNTALVFTYFHQFFFFNWLSNTEVQCVNGENNGTPFQYSCLENPRNRGAWWIVVCEVAQSRTRLKQLSSSNNVLKMVLNKARLYIIFLWSLYEMETEYLPQFPKLILFMFHIIASQLKFLKMLKRILNHALNGSKVSVFHNTRVFMSIREVIFFSPWGQLLTPPDRKSVV